MKEFVAAEWDRAQAALASAAEAAAKFPETAASRAYYAAFHAACAVLALRGKSYRKHSAVRAAVHRDLIQSGEWPQEFSQAYDMLLEAREVADYGGVQRVAVHAAAQAVERARRIIDFVKQSCPELARL